MLILHVIIDLNIGGAELMLKRLVESFRDNKHDSIIISLGEIGSIGHDFRRNGFTVHSLGMESIFDIPFIFVKLIFYIRKYKPDIVQTWMYHSDFLGGMAALAAGCKNIIWNIRSTSIPQGIKSYTYWLIRICAFFSYFIPRRIICNAHSAKIAHINLHYSNDKLVVINNGFNFTNVFLETNLRNESREFLGFNVSDIVVGVVGRFDPLKDFQNFINAASILFKEFNSVKFLMVGRGNDPSNAVLCQWIKMAGLSNSFYLVGEQVDVNYYFSSMDIFCLSSSSEAFPNVVVEAMASGLPCVVTRAGDAPRIIDNENFVVDVKDPVALANKLSYLCNISSAERMKIGEENALNVRKAFNIDSITQKYISIYSGVLKNE